MIGGVDHQLIAPAPGEAFEDILSVCRRLWPKGVFLDGDETETIPLGSPVMAWRPPSREFFVFGDPATAETWGDLGPCPENWNRMLHFICRPVGGGPGQGASVTLVVDEVTAEMRQFIDDLQATFQDTLWFAEPPSLVA